MNGLARAGSGKHIDALCSYVAVCMKIKKDWRPYIANHHKNVQYAKMWEHNFQPFMPKNWTFPQPNYWEPFGILIPNTNLKTTRKKDGDRGGKARIHTKMNMSNRVVHCRVDKDTQSVIKIVVKYHLYVVTFYMRTNSGKARICIQWGQNFVML